MKQRFLVSVTILAALCLLGACGTTSVNAEVGYTPPFLPVTLKIDSDGNVSIGLEQHIVTLIGTFTIGEDIVHSPQLQNNPLSLVVRHKANGTVVDNAYDVAVGEVDVLLDGQTALQVSQHRVFVDASAGTVQSIVIRDARPSAAPSPPTTQEQQRQGVSPADPSRPWQGTWKGIAHHAGQPPFDAIMTLTQANPNDPDSVSGDIQYQGGQCFGKLAETGRAGDTIVLREDEPDQCLGAEWEFSLDASATTLTAKATFIQFSYGNIEIDFVRAAT